MGKSVQPPPSPNFGQIAQQQGAANADAARISGRMSNPNIVSPYGNQTVTWGPNDQPTVNVDLHPVDEATLDLQRTGQWALANFANDRIGQMGWVYDQPFNFTGNPQQQVGNAGNVQTNTPNANSFTQTSGANYGSVQDAPNLFSFGSAQGLSGNPGGSIDRSLNAGSYGLAQNNVVAPSLQTSLNLNGVGNIQSGPSAEQYGVSRGGPDAPTLTGALDESGVARAPINAGTTAQDAIMSRLRPELGRQRVSAETQLINQGLRPGGEAYDNAIDALGRQENDAMMQAALQGVNLDMSANQQGFGQAVTRGQFGNDAALQQFGAGVTGTQLGNQAIDQNFSRALEAARTGNTAQQQQFMQRVQAGEFGNAAQLASFGAARQNQDAGNAAISQNFGQGLAALTASNAAQQQAFAQAGDVLDSKNSAIQQNQAAALAQQQAANAAQAQGFGNAQTVQQQANQARQQNFQNQITQMQAENAAQQQKYNEMLQSGQFANQAQAQAMAQQLQERNQLINEISALMSGSQVNAPQFQPYQGQNVQAAPIMQAGQAQAGWDQNIYNQQVAQRNAMVQGLFGLGGAATGMFGF